MSCIFYLIAVTHDSNIKSTVTDFLIDTVILIHATKHVHIKLLCLSLYITCDYVLCLSILWKCLFKHSTKQLFLYLSICKVSIVLSSNQL